MSIFILAPIYTVLSYTKFSTHVSQYGWVVSSTYVSGLAPCILLMLIWLIIIIGIWYYVRYRYARLAVKDSSFNGRLKMFERKKGVAFRLKQILWGIICFSLNCLIMLMLNGLYIYIVFTGNKSIITVAQIALAMCKLSWGLFFLPVSLSFFLEYVNVLSVNDPKDRARGIHFLLLICLLFNPQCKLRRWSAVSGIDK